MWPVSTYIFIAFSHGEEDPEAQSWWSTLSSQPLARWGNWLDPVSQATLPALRSKNAGEGAGKVAGPRDLRWDFRCGNPRQPLHQREGAAGIGDRLVPPCPAWDSPGLGALRSVEVPGETKRPGPAPAGRAECAGGRSSAATSLSRPKPLSLGQPLTWRCPASARPLHLLPQAQYFPHHAFLGCQASEEEQASAQG